ncbi:tetratricopeptide repeat protein [bacterium]|nr:tetratricopeptide repeat protein [bacterium]
MRSVLTVLGIIIIYTTASFADDASHFARRAQQKFNNRDYAGALVDYSRAINLDSSSAVLFNNRGLCHYNLDHFTEAISDYDKAISLDSAFARAYYNRGNCMLLVVNYQEAVLSYDRCLILDSLFVKAYVNRAKALTGLEDFSSAKSNLDLAIKYSRLEDPKLYLKRGNALFMMKHFEEAIEDYSYALSLDPEYYKAYVNRGMCKVELKQFEAAIRDFTLSIRFNPYNGESYYYRGMANIYRMKELSTEFDSVDPAKIADFKIYNELACSDFEKAIAFKNPDASAASAKYCK